MLDQLGVSSLRLGSLRLSHLLVAPEIGIVLGLKFLEQGSLPEGSGVTLDASKRDVIGDLYLSQDTSSSVCGSVDLHTNRRALIARQLA